MTDIAPDTKGVEYDLYLGYHPDEKLRAQSISESLRQLHITCFDEDEIRTGESKLAKKEEAMDASKSIAILLGPSGLSKEAIEESRQGFLYSLDKSKRVYLVNLPGHEAQIDKVSGWLKDRKALDFEDAFDANNNLNYLGLVRLVRAVVEGVRNDDEARKWLEDRGVLASAPKPIRYQALIVTGKVYEKYEAFEAAERDRSAVVEALESSTRQWNVKQLSPGTKTALVTACKDLLLQDVYSTDTLFMYFSGHGDLADGEPSLCVANSNPNDLFETAMPVKQLAQYVRDSPSLHKIVVLDCCYSGEASDENDGWDVGGVNWGEGSAVILASRQWVPTSAGTSELTAAFLNAWQRSNTSGELLDELQGTDIRKNASFDREIQLPASKSKSRQLLRSRPAARLLYDANGRSTIRLPDGTNASPMDLSNSPEVRSGLVDNMVELVDAVLSLVPPDQIPISSLNMAMSSLGQYLLGLTLTREARERLPALRDWEQLHLELSLDDRWSRSGELERVPWESLSLCTDANRPISIERIVRGRASKSGAIRKPPRRVVAWNAFRDPESYHGSYTDGSLHVFTHLLRQKLSAADLDLALVVREPANWIDFFDAAENKNFATDEEGKARAITDFDTLAFFAPLTLEDHEPAIWLYHQGVPTPIKCSTFIAPLKAWTCDYIILETVAGRPSQGASSVDNEARSIQATTQFATRLARQLGISVVAVCHSPHFIEAVRPTEDSKGINATFAGALLSELVNTSITLHEAASEARRVIGGRLNLGESLHVGLPIVCRAEALHEARLSSEHSKLPRAGRSS